jgi:hypothetical protein
MRPLAAEERPLRLRSTVLHLGAMIFLGGMILLAAVVIIAGPASEFPFPFVLGLLLAALAGLLAYAWYSYDRPRGVLHRQIDRMNHGRCPECGYDLTGNESGVCPECGEDFSPLRLLGHRGAEPRH